jgi:hypothetical protein
VDSARGFVVLWIVMVGLLLGYAWLDFRMNPWLLRETHFTMTPDFSQLGELWHWGGRLLRHGALPLLVGNIVVVGGVMALVVRAVVRLARRHRTEPRISIVPASVPTSIRPSN